MHTTGFWNNPVHRRSPPISTAPALWQLWQIFQSYSRHNKEPHKSSVETVGSVLTTAVRNSPLPAVPCPASIFTICFLRSSSSRNGNSPSYYNTSAKCTFSLLKITAPSPNNTTVTIQKYIVEKKSRKNHSFS